MFVKEYEKEYMQYPEFSFHKYLLFYVPPVLLIVGTFGNVLSFLILKKLDKKSSTFVFLRALAITDLIVLYIGLLRLWIEEISIDIQTQSDWLCKTTVFLGYVGSDVSVWIIIAVTAERFFVVYFPIIGRRYCNVKNAKIVILCIIFIFSSVNVHFLWSVEIGETHLNTTTVTVCNAAEEFKSLVTAIWPWVDAAIYSFIPFVLILLLNVLIIRKMITTRRTRIRRLSACAYQFSKTSFSQSQTDINRRITCMLLVVSFTFLVTTLPVNIHIIVFAINRNSTKASFVKMELAKTITELLMYTNHCLNFFLYCATGRNFRNKLLICTSQNSYQLPSCM